MMEAYRSSLTYFTLSALSSRGCFLQLYLAPILASTISTIKAPGGPPSSCYSSTSSICPLVSAWLLTSVASITRIPPCLASNTTLARVQSTKFRLHQTTLFVLPLHGEALRNGTRPLPQRHPRPSPLRRRTRLGTRPHRRRAAHLRMAFRLQRLRPIHPRSLRSMCSKALSSRLEGR